MKIAILDDNKTHLQLVEQALMGGDNDLNVSECRLFESGIALLEVLKKEAFDVVILDRSVPDMSGDVVLQWLRQYSLSLFGVYTIVIMLTNLRQEEDELYSLQSGADDYITKPFSPKRLIMRIKRLVELRQSSQILVENAIANNKKSLRTLRLIDTKKDQVIHLAGFEFRVVDSIAVYNGLSVRLTMLEFNLALLLLANTGVPISRKEFMQHGWSDCEDNKERTLTTHIHRLRQKLGLDITRGFNLRTIYGYGYRLDYDPDITVKSTEHNWSHALHQE